MSDDPIKTALRLMPCGVYVVSFQHSDDANVMTANWIVQCSFEPHRVAFALQKTACSHRLIENGGYFGMHIFTQEDADIPKRLTKSRDKDPNKPGKVSASPAPQAGLPVVTGAAAYLECRVVGRLGASGDQEILVAGVIGAAVLKPGDVHETLNLPAMGRATPDKRTLSPCPAPAKAS